MVLVIAGIISHRAILNGDIEVYTSDYPLEYTYDYITDLDNSPSKSIDDDEIDQIPD